MSVDTEPRMPINEEERRRQTADSALAEIEEAQPATEVSPHVIDLASSEATPGEVVGSLDQATPQERLDAVEATTPKPSPTKEFQDAHVASARAVVDQVIDPTDKATQQEALAEKNIADVESANTLHSARQAEVQQMADTQEAKHTANEPLWNRVKNLFKRGESKTGGEA